MSPHRHPLLFPGLKKGQRDYDGWEQGPAYRQGERFTDAWGCVWDNRWNGFEGQVVEHPLTEWAALATYRAPDPMIQGDRGPAHWEASREHIARARQECRLARGGLPHGFLLMRLWYLRGFEQLMLDLLEEPPQLAQLIDLVTAHNSRLVQEWL